MQEHGIMLSEKKMRIGEPERYFLGMHTAKGEYQIQLHIASQLEDFLDENINVKAVAHVILALAAPGRRSIRK